MYILYFSLIHVLAWNFNPQSSSQLESAYRKSSKSGLYRLILKVVDIVKSFSYLHSERIGYLSTHSSKDPGDSGYILLGS